jgi:hypothetical protein
MYPLVRSIPFLGELRGISNQTGEIPLFYFTAILECVGGDLWRDCFTNMNLQINGVRLQNWNYRQVHMLWMTNVNKCIHD